MIVGPIYMHRKRFLDKLLFRSFISELVFYQDLAMGLDASDGTTRQVQYASSGKTGRSLESAGWI